MSMPNLPGLLMTTLLNGGITQYPNKETYNAAKLLQSSERPTVPVRVVEPTDYYNSPSAKSGAVNAFVTPKRDTVYVSKRSNMLNDPKQLAAAIGHEQLHVANGPEEGPAYELQYEILKRLGGNKYRTQLDELQTLAKMMADSDKAAHRKNDGSNR